MSRADATAKVDPMYELKIDNTLLSGVIAATIDGMAMTDAKLEAVGAARFLATRREVSALISLYGDHSGTMALNVSEGTACWLASRFLSQEMLEFDDGVMDALGELANMVAGRLKERLAGTPYQFSAISVPALVIGTNYAVRYQHGIIGAGVEFEIMDMPVSRMRDRTLSTSISMMRR